MFVNEYTLLTLHDVSSCVVKCKFWVVAILSLGIGKNFSQCFYHKSQIIFHSKALGIHAVFPNTMNFNIYAVKLL